MSNTEKPAPMSTEEWQALSLAEQRERFAIGAGVAFARFFQDAAGEVVAEEAGGAEDGDEGPTE